MKLKLASFLQIRTSTLEADPELHKALVCVLQTAYGQAENFSREKQRELEEALRESKELLCLGETEAEEPHLERWSKFFASLGFGYVFPFGDAEDAERLARLHLQARKLLACESWSWFFQGTDRPVFCIYDWSDLPPEVQALISQGGDERYFVLAREDGPFEGIVERLEDSSGYYAAKLGLGALTGWVLSR